jgi:hypothetical protein
VNRLPKTICLLIFIVIILLAEGVYYYLIVKKPSILPKPESVTEQEKKEKELAQSYDQIKKKVASQQEELEEKPPLEDKCLFVPPTDPKNGIYRTDKIKTNVYDYYYEGRVVGVKETTYQDCPFINLVLDKTSPFTLNIPLDLPAITDLGKMSALIYQDHLAERVQLRVQYEQDPDDPSSLKMIEWQPLVFFVD